MTPSQAIAPRIAGLSQTWRWYLARPIGLAATRGDDSSV
jgi:hypothetical protein